MTRFNGVACLMFFFRRLYIVLLLDYGWIHNTFFRVTAMIPVHILTIYEYLLYYFVR